MMVLVSRPSSSGLSDWADCSHQEAALVSQSGGLAHLQLQRRLLSEGRWKLGSAFKEATLNPAQGGKAGLFILTRVPTVTLTVFGKRMQHDSDVAGGWRRIKGEEDQRGWMPRGEC